jgi:hypothetical protein
MKSIRLIFKDKAHLMDEPCVDELIEYTRELEGEIMELKSRKESNKELILLDMIKEIMKGCDAMEKEQYEHERFSFDAPDYKAGISNLKKYILERCRDEKIRL